MTVETRITVAAGDGIGPEIMEATLHILREAGARLAIDRIEVGEAVYKRGVSVGIEPDSWDVLRRNKVFLKAPIMTPRGGGFKSLNVTIRNALGLYNNVRPCVSYHPFISTKHPKMDVVIIRENEEDLYSGIEHRQTDQVYQTLKLISRPGSERICRAAFDYARDNDRRRVTAFVKDNIMKMTDGLFHRVFKEVAADYPEIEADTMIVDIGSARLADTPEEFDVIVTLNLYGDIISDIAAQITGSVGLAGSANIGDEFAMFEAIHGSAPDITGKGIANPSGLLLAAVMMLVHLGQGEVAEKVHNAFLRTIEDGVHTADIFTRGLSRRRVNTAEFTEALITRLGSRPQTLTPVGYSVREARARKITRLSKREPARKDLVGIDLFLDWAGADPETVADRVRPLAGDGLALKMISNRGQKVWPDGHPGTFCVDHWRCRFVAAAGASVPHGALVKLLERTAAAGLDFIKTENLYSFDGEAGYSLSQGESA